MTPRATHRALRSSLCLFVCLSTMVLGIPSLGAQQKCLSEMGAGSGTGMQCFDPEMLDLSAVDTSEYWQDSHSFVENLLLGLVPGLGDNSPGISSVLGNNGTAHLPSGQLKFPMRILQTGSLAVGGRMSLGATFHSCHVQLGDSQAGFVEEMEDPTSPFGPGWMPFWFQGLVGPVQIPLAGNQPDITWVDSEGVSHVAEFEGGYDTFTPLGPLGNQRGTSYAYYVWKAANNARLVYDAARGIFYREYAHRVRVEFQLRVANAGPGVLAYVPSRICRGDNLVTPDWSIDFTYSMVNGLSRLTQIKDARGFLIALHWQQINGSGPYRVIKISINHSTIPAPSGGWSSFDYVFEYDSNARLVKFLPPAWDYLYAASGSVASLGTSPKKGLGMKFAYDSYGELSDIYRLLKTGASWTGATEERYLHTTYVDQQYDRWKVASQTEDPDNVVGSRAYSFQHTGGDLTMVDPAGITHIYQRDQQDGQPDSWHVVKYTRKIGTSNPRSWDFAWDGCGCGRLQSIRLPSGRMVLYTYDSLGRGLLASVQLSDNTGSLGSSARNWNFTYEDWGDPGTTGAAYYKASKLETFFYYNKAGVSATWTANNAWAGGILTTTLTSPVGGYNYTVNEDRWQRTLMIQEPSFTGGGNTASVRTEFAYETSSSNGGYGLLRQVTRYPDGTTPKTMVFTRNSLGQVTRVQDEKGGITDLTLDPMGNLVQILGPTTTSGADGAGSYRPKTVLTRSLFGGVARAEIYAYDEKGALYPKNKIVSESAEDFFGELIETSTDGGKLDSAGAVALLTKRSYDAAGRLWKLELPGGRETQYVLDAYDMIQQVKVRPDAGAGVGSWPTRSFTYDVEGKHLTSTDATGKVTSYTYDAYGRLGSILRQVDANTWRKADLTYGSHANDSYRYLEKITYSVSEKPGGQSNAVTATIAERSWVRDDLGRVDTTTLKSYVGSGLSTTHKYVYNGLSRIGELQDTTNNRKTVYEYDAGGYIKKVLDNLGTPNSIETLRNDLGEVVQLIRHRVREDENGTTTTVSYKDQFTYDELGRIKFVDRYGSSQGVLARRKYGIDSLGNLTWLSNQEGASAYKLTEYDFDALGRVRKTTRHAKGGSATIVTTQDYNDGLGSFNEGTDHYGRALNQALIGQLHTRTDARGNTTKYFYDKLGTLIHRRLPGYDQNSQRRGWSQKYDAEGRLMEWMDGNSANVKLERDGYGRVTLRYVPGGAAHLSTMTTYERFAYEDTSLKTTHQTFYGGWLTSPGSGNPGTLLNQIVVQRDGLGRLLTEDFGFRDNGQSQPIDHKKLTHGYGSGMQDTTFRRSLHLEGSDWYFEFTPDAAGKMRSIGIAPPRPGGTGSHAIDDSVVYTYEGGRVATRKYTPKIGSTTYGPFTTINQFDSLGYLQSIETWFGGTSGTKVFDFSQGLDLAGNVLWRKYDKVNGKAGDYYQLDGFNRVTEVKLGVQGTEIGPGTTYAGATNYDDKLTYVLDDANNWDSVTSQQNGTNDIDIDATTNQYNNVNGSPLTYDDNGNLVADFYRVFVYDYLDRLCEVHQDPGYVPNSSSSSSSSARKSASKSNPKTAPSLKEVRTFLGSTRKSDLATVSLKSGIGAYNTRQAKSKTSSKTSSQTQNASAPSGYVLEALYGYDPNNRRIYRGLADPAPYGQEWWYTYDGWQVQEEWQNYNMAGLLVAMKVNFDGIGIDAHLGYARFDITTLTWFRYLLTQDALGSVHALLDPTTGTALERYEYDAYGKRSVYRQVSGTWTFMPLGTIYASDYGFTGRRHDAETGFCYYRNRYYWPEIGRFMTSDPIGVWGDYGNSGNEYGYAHSAPGSHRDPFGDYTVIFLHPNVIKSQKDENRFIEGAKKLIAADPEGGMIITQDGTYYGGGKKGEKNRVPWRIAVLTIPPKTKPSPKKEDKGDGKEKPRKSRKFRGGGKGSEPHKWPTPKKRKMRVGIIGHGTPDKRLVGPGPGDVNPPLMPDPTRMRGPKIDAFTAQVLTWLDENRDRIDGPVVVGVCWGDKNKAGLCEKIRGWLRGVKVWGNPDIGHVDVGDDGRMTPYPGGHDDQPHSPDPEPGPYKHGERK